MMRFFATILSIFILTMILAVGASAQEAGPLAGSQWELVTVGDTPVVGDTVITLDFDDAGQAGGNSGCNFYGGAYNVEGDTIAFEALSSTLMACLEDGIMEQEQAYLTALQSAGTYELADEQLIITHGDGQQLVYKRAASLAASQWQLESYGAVGAETPAAADTQVTLAFGDDEQAFGSGGCNSFSGSYTVEGSALTFGPLVSTLMACADAVIGEQEQAYFEALQAASGYELAGDRLTITYGDGQQLNFVRVSGSRWQLQSFISADVAASVVAESVVTLEFGEENRAFGSGGCNDFSGSYEITGDAITFSPIVSTERACAESGITEQEQAYFEALQAATRYEQAGDQLVITYGDGDQLVFTRAAMMSAAP